MTFHQTSWPSPARMYFFFSVAGASPVSFTLVSVPACSRAAPLRKADYDAFEIRERLHQRLLLVHLLASSP